MIQPRSQSSQKSSQQEEPIKKTKKPKQQKAQQASSEGNQKVINSAGKNIKKKEKVKKAKNETKPPKPNQQKEKKQQERSSENITYPLPVFQHSLCYEYNPKFTLESAKEFIKTGNYQRASQGINELLLNPPIEYLCFALFLNQKAGNRKEIQEYGRKISKLVGFKPNAQLINLKYNWIQIWPYLDFLIAEIFKNPQIEETEIKFILKSPKSTSYVEEIDNKILDEYFIWFEVFLNSKYPYAVGGGRDDHETCSIHLHNYTKREREARKLEYHFFRGELNEDYINPSTFYNLISRIGLGREHLLDGKHGYKDMVRVYPCKIETEFEREDLCQFVETYIKNKMEKTAHPYVVFVFSFSNGYRVERSIIRYGNEAGIYQDATILEQNENRIYYAFINDKRKILDLHKMSLEEAYKVGDLIQLRCESGDKECTIITGKGNHVNEDGTSGVLRDKIGEFLKKHPFVKSTQYSEGKYTVKLNNQ